MPAPAPRPEHGRRRRTALVSAVAALVGASTLVLAPPLAGPAEAARRSTEGSDLTVVQANIRSPQSYWKFKRDVASVMRYAPDLITYNEVAFRKDVDLAPKGYAVWRQHQSGYAGRFTEATPVAWRTDRFEQVAVGTRMISDWRGRPPGRQVEIGRRHANWVTLRSTEGRRLSLVSVHVSPRNRGMPDLNRRSVRRVAALVNELAAQGPVLVGGDFNVPVGGRRYPRDVLNAAKMKSTYDLMGYKFGTSDHGNGQATIDYLFVRGAGQLEVDTHFPVELRSDHDAVVAGMSWTTEAPGATTRVVNDPSGIYRERRAVARAVIDAVGEAQAGELVQVATRGTDLRPVVRALARADARGVRVQLTTRSPRLTGFEQQLQSSLDGDSWLQRCRWSCARDWEGDNAPSTVLISDSQDRPTTLVEVSRRLRWGVITQSTRAAITSGAAALAGAQRAFASR